MSAIFETIARQAWGDTAPAWIIALAHACDQGNQKEVAAKIKYSAGAVSAVLRRSYQGDLRRIERAVLGAICLAEVDCPALSMVIGTQRCVEFQRAPIDTNSPQSIRFFKKCRTCLHRIEGDSHE